MRIRGSKGLGRVLVSLVIVLVGLAGLSSGAQEVAKIAADMPGYKSTSSYASFSGGESIQAFNLGLTIAHPSSISLPQNMGGTRTPTRYYNSKDLSNAYDQPDVVPLGFLGVGWRLSYGRVFLRVGATELRPPYGNYDYEHNYYSAISVFLQDETGAERQLYWAGGVQTWPAQQFNPVSPSPKV